MFHAHGYLATRQPDEIAQCLCLPQGAVVCVGPALNETWGVANLFVFMDEREIVSRYRRHFTGRVWG